MESARKELRVSPKAPYQRIRGIEKKLDLIKRVDNGETIAEVCAKENLRQTVLSKWMENKNKLENVAHANIEVILALKDQRTMRLINDKVQDRLHHWYMACTKNGIEIRNRHIANKAKELNSSFGGKTDFTATPSFIQSWKRKYKIDTIHVNRQQKTDQTVLEHFRERLLEIIDDDGLDHQQVFICGELKIDYNTLPTREAMLQEFEGKCPSKCNLRKGSEIAAEELSIMFCSNTTGSLKLPLMVIGNSMINNNEELPVYYKYRDRDLIGGHAFEEWQQEKGMPCVRNFLKKQNLSSMALLLVSHFYTSGKIVGFEEKIAYLPPNASCIINSFNQKVLKELKIRFWLKIFSYILESRECGFDTSNIKLEEVLHLLDEAWNETSVEAFSHFWDFLSGNSNVKMIGSDITPLWKLISLIDKFYREESNACQVKQVETIEIDSDDSEAKDDDEVFVVYLDADGRETNCERETKPNSERKERNTDFEKSDANFEEEAQPSSNQEEANLDFEEEEINITVQGSENEKTFEREAEPDSERIDANIEEEVECSFVEEVNPDFEEEEVKITVQGTENENTVVSNITTEECITSLETAIQFFMSRNKYGEFSEDIEHLRILLNRACDIDIEMATN
ncbi:tigger transposable element-derived protein 4-like [Belonocnema kinseyi]|uniref:tigger transposable element-derived protein 4-like n=1 Tax=Belonocnema kinseyi TaxID=2817044 RepID=UPI00143D34AE|nr:tigger transposable element-derived protein 4-like [Belonocnema kinseyi]